MIQNYPTTVFEEMKLLSKFPQQSMQEGIKLHHDAAPEMLVAAKSLFEKGLISQPDGGYLTDLGLEITEHLHHVLSSLK